MFTSERPIAAAASGQGMSFEYPHETMVLPSLFTKVSKRNLYRWRMFGLIPYFKIGRAVRFRKADVAASLERMRMG